MTERRWLALMLMPFALGAAVLVLLPALATFWLAFTSYDAISAAQWIGWDNFTALADDPLFRRALLNSLLFAAVAVPLRLVIATALALLLHRSFRGAGTHRTIAYLPTVMPDAAYALLWMFLLNPLFGPANALLGAVRLGEPGWFADSSWAFAGIVLMACFTIGEAFVVALAARQQLPAELYDLARVEGASPLHLLRRVTLPLMAPTLLLLTVRDIALSLQVSFTAAYLITDGGPDRATLFLPLHIFDVGFEQLRYGYAAAMTLSVFAFSAVMVLAFYAVLRRWRFGLVD